MDLVDRDLGAVPVMKPRSSRSRTRRRQALGDNRREVGKQGDTLIYEEKDPAFFIALCTTVAGGHVVIKMFNGDMTEVRLVPMDRPTATPVLV